jgi:hypothetical protein
MYGVVTQTSPLRALGYRHRRAAVVFAAVVVVVAASLTWWQSASRHGQPALAPEPRRAVRIRLAAVAESQLGYRTVPATTYCNRYSAYWWSGASTCGHGERAEPWCADFAAWVWRRADIPFRYGPGRGDIGPGAVSFYRWGVVHRTWHPVGSGYVPHAGDVAVYGLDLHTGSADHVAIVVRMTPGDRGPNVVNGDGDRTGFSVVERGRDQYEVSADGKTGALAGYVSPLPPPGERGVKVS